MKMWGDFAGKLVSLERRFFLCGIENVFWIPALRCYRMRTTGDNNVMFYTIETSDGTRCEEWEKRFPEFPYFAHGQADTSAITARMDAILSHVETLLVVLGQRLCGDV
jgi:hypothetical protein